MHSVLDLRRVNFHDDRRWVGDELDLNLLAARRSRFRLMASERDCAVDCCVYRGGLI